MMSSYRHLKSYLADSSRTALCEKGVEEGDSTRRLSKQWFNYADVVALWLSGMEAPPPTSCTSLHHILPGLPSW